MSGTVEEMAELLRGYEAQGISHVQAWIDPTDLAGLDWFAGVLEVLRRS